jgi:two-component system, LuxR family, response regulator FixJ
MSETIFIVDDDPDVRHALSRLIEAAGFRVMTYSSAEAFLLEVDAVHAGCIILDVRLPDMTGPELQSALQLRDSRLPIIFLSGHADVATAVATLRAGAFHFLEKPVNANVLLQSIRAALGRSQLTSAPEPDAERLRQRFNGLTAREQSVMNLVVAGYSNRDIGRKLQISHRTVEVYRSRVMQKMRARTLLGLADYAKALGMPVIDRSSEPASRQSFDGPGIM